MLQRQKEDGTILKNEIQRYVVIGVRAATVASILFLLPACTSVSPHPPADDPIALAGPPAPAVRALDVSDHPVKPAPPAPVDDAEVSRAQAVLRDAAAWGAQYYEPQMYAKAQAALDAAVAAQEGDPVRCRSLLTEATTEAASAREAALTAYEDDVTGRFEASLKRLT